MKNRMWYAGSAAALLALTACGGGGGDDAAPNSGGSGAQASVNADNYVAVGVSAWTMMSETAGGTRTATGADVENRKAALSAFTQSQVQRALEAQASNPEQATGAVSSVSVKCAQGGSATYTYNLVGTQGTLAAGDAFKYSYSNCVENGYTWNGSIDMQVERAAGVISSAAYDLQYKVAYHNLTAKAPHSSFAYDGNLTLAIKSVAAHNVASQFVTKGLSTTVSYAGSTYTSSISDYDLRVAEAPSGNSYTDAMSLNATYTLSSLGSQTITVTTPVTWVSLGGANPSAGQMVIASSTGAKVRMTARASDVLFELDANGDGVYETRQTVSWNDL